MGTDHGDVEEAAGADRISALPDHLLHTILLRLPGTDKAARTSVLSRRWRHVWTRLPEFFLHYSLEPAASSAQPAHDLVDAALAAYAATTINRLEITMPDESRQLPADRVSAWLLVASQRLAGELQISLPIFHRSKDEEMILLPLCEKVTSIDLNLQRRTLQFRPGAFRALATLRITRARVDGRELEDYLSSRCPRLKELVLELITLQQQDGAPILSICSYSLERLEITMQFDGQLHVDAPKLQTFYPCILCDFRIVAPKLSEVRWYNYAYDPSRQYFAEAGRHLRRLEVEANPPGLALMRRFDITDKLDLTISITQGIEKYKRFLEDIDKLAKCEALVVRFVKIEHAFKSTMLHLLRKCVGVRKLVVQLSSTSTDDYPCKSSGCPCNRLENWKMKKIALDSLEEVEIKDHGVIGHKVELVRLLCKCSTAFQKRVTITVSEVRRREYMRKQICSIRPPNNVEIIVLST